VPEKSTNECSARPITAPPETGANDRVRRWLELSLVLVVSFGPFFLNGLYVWKTGVSSTLFALNRRYTTGLAVEVAGLLVLGVVLWRRRLRLRDLGVGWSLSDIPMGLAVAVVSYVVYTFGYSLVWAFHLRLDPSATSLYTNHEPFFRPSLAAIPDTLLNPFFEEVIVRAYLMTEVKDLTGSWGWATAISIAVQASYHLYFGWEWALCMSFQFLVFAVYYAQTRRATPIILAHGVFDVWALLRIW
jgi:membrane protease YdiL (CAAX protease family)